MSVDTVFGDNTNSADHRRQIARALNAVILGGGQNTGSVTLQTSTTTTVLIDSRLGPDSVVLLSPTTANAASAQAGTYVNYSSISLGSATGDVARISIEHASNSTADRAYRYAIVGS